MDFGWYAKAPLEAAFVKIKSFLLGAWQTHVHTPLTPPPHAPLRKCWMRLCHGSNWLSRLIWEYETARHDTVAAVETPIHLIPSLTSYATLSERRLSGRTGLPPCLVPLLPSRGSGLPGPAWPSGSAALPSSACPRLWKILGSHYYNNNLITVTHQGKRLLLSEVVFPLNCDKAQDDVQITLSCPVPEP